MNNASFQLLELIVTIAVAVLFAETIKRKVRNKEEFSGIGWGLLNGIVGLGILWVALAHVSINKEIDKVKSKKYKEYAQQQMKDFLKTYGICLIIWIVVYLIVVSASFR